MTDVKNWYNDYSKKQAQVGINIRHFHLVNQIIKSGLKSNGILLEVGCGIGTLTTLLAGYLKKGKIVATDISDESIQLAKSNLSAYRNIEFIVTDMIDFSLDQKFDYIVLPDVLEHIPVAQHNNLFSSLSKLLDENGKLVIHIPHPVMLEYVRQNTPEKLQVIDQSIYSDHIGTVLLSNQFLLSKYLAYSLTTKETDYVYIEAVKMKKPSMTLLSTNQIRMAKSIERIKYFVYKWLG